MCTQRREVSTVFCKRLWPPLNSVVLAMLFHFLHWMCLSVGRWLCPQRRARDSWTHQSQMTSSPTGFACRELPPAGSKTEGVFPKEQLALEEAVRLEEMLISGSQRALSEVESIQWRKPPLQMGKVHQCFLGLLIAKLIIGNRFVVHLPEPTHSTSLPIMFKGVVYLSGCYLFLKNLLGF